MKKEDIGEGQEVQETPKTTEERLVSIEDKLNKTSRWAAVVAIIGTLLGTGGLAGLYMIKSQITFNQAQARQKDAETASKELETISLNHAKTIESLRAIIEQLSADNQSNRAKEVRKILLDFEFDFQKRLSQQRNKRGLFATSTIEEDAAEIKELQNKCIIRLDKLQSAVQDTKKNQKPK